MPPALHPTRNISLDSIVTLGYGNAMPISKRKRFEIFKRDEFTCQYCGIRPPATILEVDHIEARAHGGSDDDLNLVTSCFECNRGKAAKKLGDVKPRPDADLKYLEAQQEIAEAQRYLEASRVLAQLRESVVERLSELWTDSIKQDIPDVRQWNVWLEWFSPDEIDYAIRRAGSKAEFQFGRCARGSAVKYVSGVLNGKRRESESQNVQ